MKVKKVSVIVPNYNYKRYLKKRIRSIVRQNYPIYEIIILDDASTDGSGEWLEGQLPQWREKYPRIKWQLVRNETNSGKAMRQWQKGLALAEGEFMWIAEADDLCGRKFLAEGNEGVPG